jgi:hypothetical protein
VAIKLRPSSQEIEEIKGLIVNPWEPYNRDPQEILHQVQIFIQREVSIATMVQANKIICKVNNTDFKIVITGDQTADQGLDQGLDRAKGQIRDPGKEVHCKAIGSMSLCRLR